MQIITETYYELAHSYIDDRVEYYTKDKKVAEDWEAKSSYNRSIEKTVTRIFLDKIEDVEVVEIEKKKASALAKLSKQEKELLGLI